MLDTSGKSELSPPYTRLHSKQYHFILLKGVLGAQSRSVFPPACRIALFASLQMPQHSPGVWRASRLAAGRAAAERMLLMQRMARERVGNCIVKVGVGCWRERQDIRRMNGW